MQREGKWLLALLSLVWFVLSTFLLAQLMKSGRVARESADHAFPGLQILKARAESKADHPEHAVAGVGVSAFPPKASARLSAEVGTEHNQEFYKLPDNLSESADVPELPILQLKQYTWQRHESNWSLNQEAWSNHSGRLHGNLPSSLNGTRLAQPLDRDIPDLRHDLCKQMNFTLSELPSASVIIIYSEESLELLLRTIHSILNRTPPAILHEIILVDDASSSPELLEVSSGGSGALHQHIAQLPKVRYMRLAKRTGIAGARMAGIRSAAADVFVILDSHVEVVTGWLEPLLFRIAEDPHVMVMPVIDGLDPLSHEPLPGGIGCTLGFLWTMVEHGFNPDGRNPSRVKSQPTDYITSPTMAGGLFAGHREFFLDLGGYDEGMGLWGTENLELSFRLWLCGGFLECSPCSHVHHLFGGMKRWSGPTGALRNQLRTMAVWMDDYADLSWNVLGRPRVSFGDVGDRLELRERLQCRDFQWFLRSVFPESDVRELRQDVPYLGEIRHQSFDVCLAPGVGIAPCPGTVVIYFKRSQRIVLGRNDETCLSRSGTSVMWKACEVPLPESQLWQAEIPGPIQSGSDCLAVSESFPSKTSNVSDVGGSAHRPAELRLVVESCVPMDAKQMWTWTPYSPTGWAQFLQQMKLKTEKDGVAQ